MNASDHRRVGWRTVCTVLVRSGAAFGAACVLRLMIGDGIALFADLQAFLAVLLLSAAMGLLSFGLRGCARALLCLRTLAAGVQRTDATIANTAALRGIIRHLYTAGGIAAFIAAVKLLANLFWPEQMYPALAVSLIPLLYAAVIAELLLRPAVLALEREMRKRVASRAGDTDQDATGE